MNEWIMLGVGVFIGVLAGIIFTSIRKKSKYSGTLVLYRETPRDPVQLIVELNEQPETLYGVPAVTFNVISRN